MRIITIIPARGGSKGIPRKNVRYMKEKPLIAYAIENALLCKDELWENTVVVSTDDEDIAIIAKQYGALIVMRPPQLAMDDVTLDPVVCHAVDTFETLNNCKYDCVITMQPTSPTLKSKTLHKAVETFIESEVETLISVKSDKHLAWEKRGGVLTPAYACRVNRQKLPDYYRETGAFLISKRDVVKSDSRIGETISVYILPECEAVDIDTEDDWILCESILGRKKIIFRADGEENLGMGHVYRCLSLAYNLLGNDIIFCSNSEKKLGYDKFLESNYRVIDVENDLDFIQVLKDEKPDIVVNDILDTDDEYMRLVKKYAKRVVNFEDKGRGAVIADAVINALYENEENGNRKFFNGFKYFFIRNEFLETKPKPFSEEVREIVFLFGGADPSNMTQKCYDICKNMYQKYIHIKFVFITGFGYKYKNEIVSVPEKNIFVYHDVKRVSSFLSEADLAVTSQGRTIYELACMGVPAIVLAQNKRETEHHFASVKNGFINLGIGVEIETSVLVNTIEWLINTAKVREDMREAQLSKNFRLGQKRVKNIILGNDDEEE